MFISRRGTVLRNQPRRLGITGNLLRHRIVTERAAELHGDVCQDARGGRDVPLLDIGHGPAAGLDGGEKILHVAARGGRACSSMSFSVTSSGILLALVNAVAMDGFAVSFGNEIVARHAGLERSLVAEERHRPGILRIRR